MNLMQLPDELNSKRQDPEDEYKTKMESSYFYLLNLTFKEASKRRKITKSWKNIEIIFCITNEISFTIISLSSSDKFFLESWFSSWNYYYITNYHWNLLRFTLYIRS